MHVHFLCDQKWRDLPTVAAMKLSLEALGVSVTAASSKETFSLLAVLQPDAVVLNHMYSKRHQELAAKLRSAGIAVIVQPTEGKGEPAVDRMIWGEFNDYSNIDLFLSWNERTVQNLVDGSVLHADKVRLVGCTRYDFYRYPWFSVTANRETFCRRFNLDPAKSIVTWTTKFGYAKVFGNQELTNSFVRDFHELNVYRCYNDIGYDWQRLPAVHHDSRVELAKGFFELAASRPNLQFIIKPHPTEERSFYENHINERRLPNVRLIYGEYIWDVLNNTDVLLQQRCSTAMESWLLGKPTIEMNWHDDDALAWPEYQAGSHKANSPSEMIDLVDNILEVGEVVDDDMRVARESNIREFAWKVDGARSSQAAHEIFCMLSDRGTTHKRNIRSYDLGLDRISTLRTGVRYFIGLKPSQSLRRSIDVALNSQRRSYALDLDKEITRHDLARYVAKLKRVKSLSRK